MTKVALLDYRRGPYCIRPAYLLYVSRGCSVSFRQGTGYRGQGTGLQWDKSSRGYEDFSFLFPVTCPLFPLVHLAPDSHGSHFSYFGNHSVRIGDLADMQIETGAGQQRRKRKQLEIGRYRL